MGDKKKYKSVLEPVYSGRIDDGENSRLMQSHTKTVWEHFGDALLSDTKVENHQRGRPRPRREMNRRPAHDFQHTVAIGPVRVAIRPPPALEIRNVDERSYVTSTTSGPLLLTWPSFNYHYSGARTT